MIRELLIEDLSLWGCVWQSTLFAAVGLIGSFLLRRRPARASQVLLLAMIAAVIVPAMGVLVKHFELGVLVAGPIQLEAEMPNEPVPIVYETPGAVPPADIGNEVHTAVEEPALVEARSGNAGIPWRMILLCGWMTATSIFLGRLLVAVISGVCLLRRAQPWGCEQIRQAANSARSRLGINKDLCVRNSMNVSSPVIWCWSRLPVLLVQSDLDRRVDWVGVICHELAHWRRKDHLTGLIAELALCILPWNPLLWWSKKRMVRFSEQACDDWVVAGGQPCEDYAQSLLNFRPQKQVAFVPAVVSSKKTLAGRVRRILKNSCSNPRTGAVWALTVTLIAICLAVGIAFAQTKSSRSTGTVKTTLGRSAVIEQPAFATMTIKGRVVHSDNEPAYRGDIIALPVTSYGARTDREGYFELPWSPTWIDEGRPVCLIARTRDFTPRGNNRRSEAAVVEVLDPTQPVTIRLEPSPLTIGGKVVDPNGQRLQKYRATLLPATEFKCQTPIFESTIKFPQERIFSSIPYGLEYRLTIGAEGYQAKHLTVDATDRSKEIVDIGLIILQPQHPARPVVSEQGPNPDLEKEFHDIYRLEDGEVIKFIKPPFVLGRQEYLHTVNPECPLGLQQGPGWQAAFHWDGELKVYSEFSGPDQKLGSVLRWVPLMPGYDYKLPEELNIRAPHGDWIVRAGLPAAEQLRAFEEILRAELKRSIRFEKRTVEREVIVATGRFEFKPLRSEDPNWLYLYLNENDCLLGNTVCIRPASISELLPLIADADGIDTAIEDKTEPCEIPKIRCRCSNTFGVDMSKAREKNLPILLDNLSKQTGLQFKVERRPAEMWFVTETKNN